MLNRTAHALALARRIEAVEHCPFLTNESIQRIEQAYTDYAIDRIQSIRSTIINTTMSAATKTRLVSLLDAAIHAEVTQ